MWRDWVLDGGPREALGAKKVGKCKKMLVRDKKSLFFLCRIEIIFYFCSVENDNIKLGYGVMVTLQILVLSF